MSVRQFILIHTEEFMYKKSLSSILTIIMLIILGVSPVLAGDVVQIEPLTPAPSAETGVMTDETPQLWFVELTSNPTADGTSLTTVRAEKAAFRQNARRANLVYTERYAFDKLFNGFSIRMDASQLGKLARIPGVKNIYPVETIPMPTGEVGNPDLFTALNMTGAATAQSELGFTGAGIKVAVMDTGIDVDHPAFGGDGVARYDSPLFPSARVAYGYDFVGDAFNADPASPSYNPVAVPDPNPDDCAGHGTHVSGIIGANDATNGLKGVAPDVTFGVYRVFGCEGSTTADIMIAAMERALADGMQILNMSIGSAFQWPQYPTAVAATRLVNAGMVVVASIGNSGANGLYSAGAPGLGSKVIGVASYDNTHVLLPYFSVNDRNIGYVTMTFSAAAPLSGSEEIVYVGRGCVDADTVTPGAQTDPYLADPNGKAALIVRGACSFGEKAIRAIAAGATAVVIMNSTPGVFNGTLGAPIGSDVPVVGISQADGNFIIAQTAPITMAWTDQQGSFPSPTGGLISSFSSYGLSPDLALKPDIGAPGGNIYSSYPLELGGYATLGGTSMASPHVAGAVALLLQARPNTPSQAVRGILQNSADPKNWWGNPGLGYLDMVHRQGAGMLDIDDAILATTVISPAKISTGESQAGAFSQKLTIENKGTTAVTYTLSHAPALSSGPNTFTVGASTGFATVTFSAASVTVPAGGTAKVTVTITANAALPDLSQYGGYIVFTPQGGGQVYRVPYAGLKGDYQTKIVLTSGGYGLPWLSVLYAGSYYQVTDPSDWTFTMQGSDIPFFLVHFDHQSALFRMEIFSSTGRAWHRAYNETWMGRNSTSTSFFAFPFDGVTFAGSRTYQVPDGTYYALLSVLKANGNPDIPSDWETWTSPMFVIDRP
jgi:minor extracellular serine protease Vpr